MGFHESTLKDDYSYRSARGPGFKTDVIVLDSGQEQAVARFDGARHRYNLARAIQSYDDLAYFNRFYYARRGVANGFRMRDWLDYATTSDGMTTAFNGAADVSATDVEIGTGDNSEVQFQLKKFYTEGNETRTRNITKPIAGTVKVALDGVEQSSGWSVNTTTGMITFTSAPGSNVTITAGCEFHVPVRFGTEIDELFSMTLEDFQSGGLEIPLIELINPSALADEFWYGGSTTFDPLTANQTLSVGLGRAIVVDNINSGLELILPDKTSLPPGGPYFYLINEDGAESIDITDDDAATNLATIAAGAHAEAIISLQADNSTKEWKVLT